MSNYTPAWLIDALSKLREEQKEQPQRLYIQIPLPCDDEPIEDRTPEESKIIRIEL